MAPKSKSPVHRTLAVVESELRSDFDYDIPRLFKKGLALHQKGSFAQAKEIYQQILASVPDHFDALHLSGVIAYQTQDAQLAVELIRKAIKVNANNAAAFYNLANALSALKYIDEALVAYDKAIELKPDHAKAYLSRGNAFKKSGRTEEALESYDRAIAIRPEYAEAYYCRGVLLQRSKRLAEALDSYDKAISISSDDARTYSNRGVVLQELKRLEEALESYDQAIAISPDYAQAHFNRGNVCKDLKRFGEALLCYERAIAINPDYAEVYSNRGNVLKDLNRIEEAFASYDTAIKIKPDFAEVFSNRGVVCHELNRIDEAIAFYDKAIEIRPGYADPYWNKSLALLLTGDFSDGWQLYEWRWKREKFTSPRRNFSQPLWLGADSLQGKTILLHAEQGLGDAIQFCRYTKLVKALGARVILEVHKGLLGLLKGLEGVDQLIQKGQPLPDFDCHCPLLSLPLAFKTDLSSIPHSSSYIGASPEKLSQWAQRLGGKDKLRVGLVWSGSVTHQNDHNRSITLKQLLPYLPNAFDYVSLQKDVRESDMQALEASGIRHYGRELKDFTDTAALCDLMDLVISVDTSVAHLAGAIGKTTWVLLPYAPDWRWLLNRDDSPWYASVTLYRQDSSKEWLPVLRQVEKGLRSFVPDSAHKAGEIATLFKQGLALHRQGQLAQAQLVYQQVLEKQPQHFDALHLSGVIAYQSNNSNLAVELIGKALKINPNNSAAYSNRGIALKELKRVEEAITSYDRAIALKSDYADAYYNRGNALKELKRVEEAIASYDRAIAINPDHAEAYYNRGVALKELKRMEE